MEFDYPITLCWSEFRLDPSTPFLSSMWLDIFMEGANNKFTLWTTGARGFHLLHICLEHFDPLRHRMGVLRFVQQIRVVVAQGVSVS